MKNKQENDLQKKFRFNSILYKIIQDNSMQVDESKFFLQPFYPQEVIENFQNFDKWFSKINLHSTLNTMDITTQR